MNLNIDELDEYKLEKAKEFVYDNMILYVIPRVPSKPIIDITDDGKNVTVSDYEPLTGVKDGVIIEYRLWKCKHCVESFPYENGKEALEHAIKHLKSSQN